MGRFSGGRMMPGLALTGEKGPEPVATSGNSTACTAAETKRTLKGPGQAPVVVSMPEKFTVAVGSREFGAYTDDRKRMEITANPKAATDSG